jgi:ribonuclease P protein subunit RPR2
LTRVRIPAVALRPLFFKELPAKRKAWCAVRKKGKGKAWVQEIALERIYRLFELAGKEFGRGNRERANRYVALARKIGTRNRATIPTELKRKFCKKCGAFLAKGKNADWNETEKWVEIKCRECGAAFKRRLE